MWNKKRKEILEEISAKGKENVSNNLKGMYGLTPYYHENEESSLFMDFNEQLLLYKNYNRSINHEHEKDIYLMPEQEKYLKELLKSKNKMICFQAPTSFGKSLLIKEYIYLTKPSNVVYIVPTNALAYELEKSYKDIFSSIDYKKKQQNNYVVFDSMKKNIQEKDIEENDIKEIFIGTPEKFFDLKEHFNDVDLFIIDEAYKLEEKIEDTRGYILSKTLLDHALVNSKKIILLTPTATIKGLEDFDCKFLYTDFNAVDIKMNNSEEIDINEMILNKEKTIYYVKTPIKVIEILNGIEERKSVLENNDVNFLNHLKSEYTEDYSVYKALKKGVLIHHGQMPKYIQNKMINKYILEEKYNFIIGTNSLSEGINTPTKNLIFDKQIDFNENKMLLRNTIGRAGRLGAYPLGYIYLTKKQKEIYKKTSEIEVNIALGEVEARELIKEKNRIKKLKELLTITGKNKDVDFEKLLKDINLPINNIEKFLEEIKKDYKEKKYYHATYGVNFINIILDLSNEVSEFFKKYELVDNVCYLSSLLYNSKIHDGVRYQLEGHKNKIKYLSNKLKEDKTKIIDGYFKMRYSSLEYKIMPVVNLYFTFIENEVEMEVGEHVHETMVEIRKRYSEHIMNRKNFFDLEDNKKKILLRLNEYGINITERIISDDMIKEIENKLNFRYSMFDIINVIKDLSLKEGLNQEKYKTVLENYID